ncbi:MAG: selenium-dependent molybdenum cofactor biosynthesis protein YqeB [Desulfotomaculaceae bacterium]|nr:selenium-dependent molybdenum cofactor biosynthesis protein YqeB [Desulfotomaculaceae bacterium]
MGKLGMITLIKGADDLATGVAYRLYKCGLDVIMTETGNPLVVRRKVAFAEAVQDGTVTVEGIKASLASSIENALAMFDEGIIPVLIDPEAKTVEELYPQIVVDARMAKRNLGTTIEDAALVIGLGPGFEAGIDVHAVIETCRGHRLGRVIYSGGAIPNTGVPGDIGGYTVERMIKAPVEGIVTNVRSIGEAVKKGDIVATVDSTPVRSKIAGVVRGMVREGISVPKGARIANIDPRKDIECDIISDRALSIGGGVLEAVFSFVANYEQ